MYESVQPFVEEAEPTFMDPIVTSKYNKYSFLQAWKYFTFIL